MNRIIAFALLIAGIVLLVFGFNASESLGSDVSRTFTGTPTDKSIWLLVTGGVLTAIGALGVLRKRA